MLKRKHAGEVSLFCQLKQVLLVIITPVQADYLVMNLELRSFFFSCFEDHIPGATQPHPNGNLNP